MKKKIFQYLFVCLLTTLAPFKNLSGFIPHPDHVVVLIMENTSYNQIIGSSAAPYINSLVNDSNCALFTQSYGMTRPSQPNYLQLFSGSTQGVTSNNLPSGLPFTTPNLGRQLLNASYTFMGYSESMPNAGYTGEISGAYARKHNPWVNWQDSPTNGIPAALNETYSAFPNSSNYALLPDLSIVVPNQDNDMHNGTYPTRVTIGDTWIQNNMDAYIQWAKTHNSLFILTFDEDDFSDQHIVTLFIGPMVKKGSYSTVINHYNMLGLMEDMFSLPRIAGATGAAAIDYCWIPCYQLAEVNADGPVTFCQGGSVTLSASGGSSFLWSGGETTQAITVNSTGNYSVTINDGAGCTKTSSPVNVTVNNFNYTANVFSESMGMVSSNTTISVHESSNGFDNDSYTMTGTGDIRNSSVSSGYANASGGANVFLTNTTGRYFQIENINTTALPNLQLSFGIFKSASGGTGTDLLVRYSTDGVNYSALIFDPLPTGTGTAKWYLRTASGSLPAVSNLRLKFIQNGTVSQYRIDDIVLKYNYPSSQISAAGPVEFCPGGSVFISATPASSYLWSNGATTQDINVTSGGDYFVTATGNNGCTTLSNTIHVTLNQQPLITDFSPLTGSPGSVVTINGDNFSGVDTVKFNGIPATFWVIDDNTINAYVPPGSASGVITVINTCFSTNSSQSFVMYNAPSSLQLELFIEGFYLGSGQMISSLGGSLCDSIKIELRNKNAPFDVQFSQKGIINTEGLVTFTFPQEVNGNYFYIVVAGRNTISTWSALPVLFSESVAYNFKTSASAAFGNNLKASFDNYGWCLYSGDVNEDGAIDGNDFLLLDIDVKNGDGGYIKSDINGDGAVDGSDFLLMDPNIQLGIGVSMP